MKHSVCNILKSLSDKLYVKTSITAKNMEQYADKLNPGTKAMFKRYPDTYRLDVYKTRRTQATPEWVYANTLKNAVRTSLTEDGLGMKDAYGGIPFPIPKRGEEVIFNHILRYGGAGRIGPYFSVIVNADGTFTAGGGGGDFEQYPYYFKDGSLETFKGDIWYMLNTFSRPARRKGELLLVKDPLDKSKKSGSRHIYAKRVFFIDEDSWTILLKDQYDGRGNLWRTGVGTNWNHYDLPANILLTIIDYDFQKERYAMEAFLNYDEKYVLYNSENGIDKKYFKTEYLRKLGRR